jgi:hypothetical protein
LRFCGVANKRNAKRPIASGAITLAAWIPERTRRIFIGILRVFAVVIGFLQFYLRPNGLFLNKN